MYTLLHHIRVGLAHTTPRSGTRFRQSFLLMAALLLLATQLAAPASRSVASAAPRTPSAPMRTASISGAGTPDVVNLDYTGTGGGVAMSVAISGSVAYLVESNKLIVLDIHNPAAPQWLGEYRFEKVSEGGQIHINVVGSYAYIADPFIGLLIIDVSNPQQPSRCGLYTGMSSIYDVDVVGSTAYVAGEHFQILDVHNPCAPKLLGATPKWASRVVVSNGQAYLGMASDGVRIVNVSNPAAPVELGTYQAGVGSLTIVGTRLYIGGDVLVVLDVSKPATPKLLGHYQTIGWAMSLSVAGSLVYIAEGVGSTAGVASGRLEIINVANPSAPSLVGSYAPLLEGDDVQVSGSFAYVAVSWDDLRVLDITQPAAPKLYGGYTTLKRAEKIHVEGSLAYIGSNRFDIVDLSQPNNPKVLGTYQPAGGAGSDIEIVGSLAYLAGTNLEIVDVHDPTHPTVLGHYDVPIDPAVGTAQFISHVQVVGARAYLGIRGFGGDMPNDLFGLLILDVSNPAAPQLVGRYETSAPVNDVQVVDSQVYLALGDRYALTSGGLVILDVADPTQPTLIGAYQVPAYVNKIQIVGDIAYLSESYYGLDILDISDRSNPRLIGQYSRPLVNFPILAIHIDGAIAYLMADDIELVNLTDLAHPRRYATYPTPGYVLDMQTVGDQIYVADGTGLTILHVERDQASAEIAPSGGSLANKIQTATVSLPPNAVDSTVVVSYTGYVAPTQPLPDDRRVVRDIEIDAQRQAGAPLDDFVQPYTLELRYNQRQLGAALAQESTLGVVVRDGDAWADLPQASYTVDTANDRVIVTGTQAREYALVGRSARTFVPLMSH